MIRLSRRTFLASSALAAIGGTLPAAPVRAEDRYLDIRPGGNFNPVMIAVAPFAGEGGDAAKVTGIVVNDFKRCVYICLLYTSPSPRDGLLSRMPSSA